MPPKSSSKPSGKITKRASKPRGTTKVSTRKAALSASTAPQTADSATDDVSQASATSPVYFWKPAGGNGYLGQWYPSVFTVDGETYQTAEMWMMVSKAKLFGDDTIAQLMLQTTDPKTHKELGRKVGNFDGQKWDEEKLGIVEQGNYYKFTISEDAEKLRGMLLATGDRELVEASPRDRIWGIGFGEANAEKNRRRWGQNLLGKALVAVRERLRKEEGKDGEEK